MRSAIRSARRLAPSEGQVKKAVCDWLEAKRIRYHRLNAGGTVTGEGAARRFIRMAGKGTPDLLVIAPTPGWESCERRYCPVYIELKAPGKGPNPAQRAWHDRARREGLDVYVCGSVEEVAEALGMKA